MISEGLATLHPNLVTGTRLYINAFSRLSLVLRSARVRVTEMKQQLYVSKMALPLNLTPQDHSTITPPLVN